MNGYYGDSAFTYEVGDVSKEEVKNLLISNQRIFI